jgi:hypothetical protein
MKRKSKFEIVGAILILIILLVFLWWLFARNQPTPETTLPPTTEQAGEGAGTVVAPVEPHVAVTTAPTIARSFVERLGSFSTESDYKNIDDVMSMASAGLQNKLKALKATALKSPAKTYYGVSTRVVTLETATETETTATINITTSRTESVNDPRSKSTRYQDVTLNLVKSGNTWLVEDYQWVE